MNKYFQDIQAKHRVRDPLYGFIYLTDAERRVIDTPLFQRLRRVQQLALTKYVYPSAEHSRFVHSLGVMHCATLILAGVFGHKSKKLRRLPSENMIKTLRYAALLHDIGHLPFSHASERHFLHGLSHEDLSQHIIKCYKPISTVIAEDGIEPNDVASLLAKKPPRLFMLEHEIVSGQLDADRADYLRRDSLLCGVKYGEYDFCRFLQIFTAQEDESSGLLRLIVDESDLHVAESLLIARYHYNMQVPFHRTRMGFDLALSRFLQNDTSGNGIFTITGNKLTNVDFDALEDFDDNTILESAKRKRRAGCPWAGYLLRNKHLVPLIDTTAASPVGAAIFKAFANELRNSPHFTENEDFFVKDKNVEIIKPISSDEGNHPAPGMDAPPAFITLRSKEGKGRQDVYIDITERSWIFKQLATQPPAKILRIYVTPEKMPEARNILGAVESNVSGAPHEL